MGASITHVDQLVEGLETKDRGSLARAISLVENRAPGYQELLSRVHPQTGGALRVGITGPPGAGKSTIVDALAGQWAAQGQRIGIVAVDPTSPFTGGALLGDRVRMGGLSTHPEVFIRSMATRGSSGGLAAATRDVLHLMDAFGFDWLVVETVGVGQIEIEVMNVCDSVVVVFVPESGDGVQALKAGLIEIAHMFVVNKADRPGAELLAREVHHALSGKRSKGEWSFPIQTCVAVRGTGVPELASNLAAHRTHLKSSGRLARARQRQALADIEHLLMDRVHTYLFHRPAVAEWLNVLSNEIAEGGLDPHRAAGRVWARLIKTENGGSEAGR